MAERGEFTRKFDRDILRDETAADEEREVQRLREQAEDKALEAEFEKILSVLEYRSSWLRDRFPRCREVAAGPAVRGRRFEFTDAAGNLVGWIEFRTRLTDSELGIALESYMELSGRWDRPRHDYVNFPKEQVNLDRTKRFVEAKLLEFAAPYQDAYGA